MSLRDIVIDATTQLVTEECFSCHVLFAFPVGLQKVLLQERGPQGRQFYCPNGHSQYYLGKTEAAQLRDQLAQVARERDAAARDRDWLSAQVDQERTARAISDRRRAAYQGQVTKLKERAKNGVCAWCNRTFANVAKHVQTRHPDADTEAHED